MKPLLLVLVFSFIAICFGLNPPSATSLPFPAAGVSTFPLLKEIGAADFTSGGSSSISESGVFTPYGLATIPNSGLISSPYTYGGLVAIDQNSQRGNFYANPVPVTGGKATAVYGQTSFTGLDSNTANVLPDPVAAAYTNKSLYLLDKAHVNVWNWGYIGSNQFNPYPNYILGGCGTCGYSQLTTGSSLAADRATGTIYVGDIGCPRIFVFNQGSNNNSAPPIRTIGQTSASSCSSCSSTTTTTTCVYPKAMTVDCYGGLWVFDSGTNSILHIPQGSSIADFAFKSPTTTGHTTDLQYTFAIDFDASTCNRLAIATIKYHYIVQVTYVNNAPTAVTTLYTFGGGNDTSPTATTNSLSVAYGITWDVNNPDYLWMSDFPNTRYVYFTPFGTNAPSQSFVPSPTPSVSMTRSVSTTATATPSKSITSTPSQSIGASPSSSTSFIPASSGAVGVSSSPFSSPISGNLSDISPSPMSGSSTGSGNSLRFWWDLLV